MLYAHLFLSFCAGALSMHVIVGAITEKAVPRMVPYGKYCKLDPIVH